MLPLTLWAGVGRVPKEVIEVERLEASSVDVAGEAFDGL